ncbi:MAG TPA: hypothetical protein VGO47_10795 [Chlamydiales bacterium]|jgi:hypothetical protein|nr:hypothetical protein [Chlamydiales bacterium]
MPPRAPKAALQSKGGRKPVGKVNTSTGRDEVDISLIRTDKRKPKPHVLDDGSHLNIKEIVTLSRVTEESNEEEDPESPFEEVVDVAEDVDSSSESPDAATSGDEEVELNMEKETSKKKSAGRPKAWYNQGESLAACSFCVLTYVKCCDFAAQNIMKGRKRSSGQLHGLT